MKPFQTFLFLIFVAVGIVLLSVVFRGGGICVFHGIKLRFLSLNELSVCNTGYFSSDKGDDQAMELQFSDSFKSGQDSAEMINMAAPAPLSEQNPFTIVPDTFTQNDASVSIQSSESVPGIIFPENNRECLDDFFDQLAQSGNSSECSRIIFVGDSQIEGDHICGTFRENFQKMFSGEGIGLLPIKDLFNRKYGFVQKVSDNWKEYPVYSKNEDEDARYGVAGSYYKLMEDEATRNEGWIEFRRFRIDSLTRNNYRILNLYYTNPGRDTSTIEVRWNGRIIKNKKLLPTDELQTLKYAFNFSPREIELYFKAGSSLRVYGLSMEGVNGVMVDNLPHRGCATPELRRTDLQFYKSMLNKMKISMAIFQFGVNVVPYAGSNPVFYEERLCSDLMKFKKLVPEVPVLVVGVSDMSKKNGSQIISWPNIQAVKIAQLRAAQRAGCAFWDLEAAMGGRNSMVAWVNSTPQLGKKDYIHFTNAGAEKVGNMLSNAILAEYKDYENRRLNLIKKQLAQK